MFGFGTLSSMAVELLVPQRQRILVHASGHYPLGRKVGAGSRECPLTIWQHHPFVDCLHHPGTDPLHDDRLRRGAAVVELDKAIYP